MKLHIRRGTDHSSGIGVLDALGDPKICNFDFSFGIQKNVLRLDVPVD